jgi:hypothetical protein
MTGIHHASMALRTHEARQISGSLDGRQETLFASVPGIGNEGTSKNEN